MARQVKKLKLNNTEVQVESAVCDGKGNEINNFYASKDESHQYIKDYVKGSVFSKLEFNEETGTLTIENIDFPESKGD